jgi:cytochrome b6-f complex iron-sulfur subunit
MAPLAISTGTLILVVVAAGAGLAGFGLIGANLMAIVRAKREGPRSHRPLIGRPAQVSRRTFFRRILGLGFGIAMLDFGVVSVAFLWPRLTGGFGSKITLPQSLAEIRKQIEETKQPFFFANGRFYLVEYPNTDDPKNIYAKEGVAAEGIMAIYQRCPHLGCRVSFCSTSQWFECPCHGSKYNRAGEYKLGPAPRSMDRMALVVEKGIVTVDTNDIKTGPPRGTNTTGQEKEGPFCV